MINIFPIYTHIYILKSIIFNEILISSMYCSLNYLLNYQHIMLLNVNLQKVFCWHRILFYTCTIIYLTKCLFGGIYTIVVIVFFFTKSAVINILGNFCFISNFSQKSIELCYKQTIYVQISFHKIQSNIFPLASPPLLPDLDNTESLKVLSMFSKLLN